MTSFKIIVIPMVLVCLAVATGYEVRDTSEAERLPGSGWSVGFHLYQAERFDSLPVRVTSITSKGNKGLTDVELRNRSTKAVSAVKIGWYVSTVNGPGTILTQGESSLLSLTAPLQANEKSEFSVPPISLAKILKPMVKGNTLRGDFSVQVAVTEIVYEDGSTWKFSQPDNVAQIKVRYAHAQGGCGYSCVWIPESESYACVQTLANTKCILMGGVCITQQCEGSGD